MTAARTGRFKGWLWRSPRPHGATIVGRRVSYLELFYDLAYVAIIGQATHQLAGDVSVRGVLEFSTVFALIWIAWVNGSLYIELHGGEDGRTRNIVFAQMCILVLLAVFTGNAANNGGMPFSLVYAAFLVFTAWLWLTVRNQDRQDRPEFLDLTGRYVIAMLVSAAVILASAFLATEPRLLLWALFAIAWIGGLWLLGRSGGGLSAGLTATDSLVERFGSFTIIVLGEVIIGVVAGLVAADRDALTIAVGLLALIVGFGFWWIYFDLVGGRLPRNMAAALTHWVLSHFPIALSIAASGAAMVSLIGHAHDANAPAGTSWLLGGAVSVGLLALIVIEQSLVDAEHLVSVYRPISLVLAVGAVAALVVGWIDPAPWLLALLLVVVLSVLWSFAVLRFLSADAWRDTAVA
jgi:low temperature requirement protein LtrA